MTIGTRLQNLRKEASLSQASLGEKLGVAQSTIRNYETDARMPDSEFIKSICVFFDVAADWLIFGDNNQRVSANGGNPMSGTSLRELPMPDEKYLELLAEKEKLLKEKSEWLNEKSRLMDEKSRWLDEKTQLHEKILKLELKLSVWEKMSSGKEVLEQEQ